MQGCILTYSESLLALILSGFLGARVAPRSAVHSARSDFYED